MLHMLVNTHSEDSCAFRSEENREVLVGGFTRFAEAAGQRARRRRGKLHPERERRLEGLGVEWDRRRPREGTPGSG